MAQATRQKSLSAYKRTDGSFDILSLVKDSNAGLSNQIFNTLDRVQGRTRGCSTGLLTLDYHLNGALPVRKLNYYYGHNQSGKSTNMYFAVREAQRQGRIVIFVDAELSIEADYLTQLGVDINSPTTIFIRPLKGEDVMLLLKRVLGMFAEDNYYFEDHQTPLIIFDSLAALVPEGVYAEKESRAMLARLLSDNLKALNALIQYINGTLIAVNQIRSNAGVMFTPLINEPGGWAVKFYPSTKIKIKAKDPFTYEDGVPGYYAEFTLTKTRHCAYFPPQLIALRTGTGFNQMDDLLKMMDASGFLLRPTVQSYELNNALFRKFLPSFQLPQKLKLRNADMTSYLYDHFEELYLGMRQIINDGEIFGNPIEEQTDLLKRLEQAEQRQIELAEELAKANDLPTPMEGMALMDTQGSESLGKELQRIESGKFTGLSMQLNNKKPDESITAKVNSSKSESTSKKTAKPELTPVKKSKLTKSPTEPIAASSSVPPPVSPQSTSSDVYSNALTEIEDTDAFEF